MNSPAFVPRACPNCSGEDRRTLIAPTARDICRSNWSYRADALERLALRGDESFPIVQCSACGFVFASRLPSAQFLDRLYDEVIDGERVRQDNAGPRAAADKMQHVSCVLRSLAASSGPLRVLDFGCGFGTTLRLLRAIDGVTAVGWEPSAVRAAQLRREGHFVVRSGDELDPAVAFDALIMDNVLEHLPDPRATLADLRKRVRRDAIVFVSVPAQDAATLARAAADLARGGPLAMDINPWEHLNYFDPPHLDGMLSGAGFAPLPQSQLPWSVDIGLRPERTVGARARNALASLRRMARYVRGGDAVQRVTARFYRAA